MRGRRRPSRATQTGPTTAPHRTVRRRLRSGRGPSGRCRAAPTARARRRLGPRPAPHQRAERVVGVQRAVRAAADVVGAAPVQELVAGRAESRTSPRCGSAAPTRRGPWRPDSSEADAPLADLEAEQVEVALDAPALAAPVLEVAAGAKRSSSPPRAPRIAPRRPGGRSSASRGRRPRARAAALDRAGALRRRFRGRARRPARSASSGRARSRRLPPRAARRAARQLSNARKRSISSSTCDCEWSEQTITAWSSRNASAPPAASMPRDLAVGGGDRVDLRERPVLVRVRVVVGQREQQEVEQVVLDQVRADAAGSAGRARRAARAASGRASCREAKMSA